MEREDNSRGIMSILETPRRLSASTDIFRKHKTLNKAKMRGSRSSQTNTSKRIFSN